MTTIVPPEEPEGLGPPLPPPAAEPPPPGDGWTRDKQGREYVIVPGRRGPLYRRGGETLQERLERDQRPKDEKPKGKARRKAPGQPDAPKDVDLRGLEAALAEAFRSPAMMAGLAGDVYLANHFTLWGPRLARNLVVTAEHNPWLRRHLESMATGGAATMAVMSTIGLAGGVLAYAAPPIIYLFNLPRPAMAQEMFGIPERRNGAGPQAAPPQAA